MDPPVEVRLARVDDCDAIARIYNEGIAERSSTFETELRSAAEIESWVATPSHPVLVVERAGEVAGWARCLAVQQSCLLRRGGRGQCLRARARARAWARIGAGLSPCATRPSAPAFTRSVGRLFADNEPSRRLIARHGFREVGTHLRHGRVDGSWRDVVVVDC